MPCNASGTLLKRYVHGVGSDDPLVSYDGAGTTSPSYLLADERGSIVAETNASGTVVQKHQYGPYGEPINQSSSRFRYTGQILLPGTELYHYKARVYHPKLGRFLQTDPIGYKDGMNWYAYVGNDPMNGVDPEGLCKKGGIGTRICGGISMNSSEYGVSSFGKVLSDSPVGQAWKGGAEKVDNNYMKMAVGAVNGVRSGVTAISARATGLASVLTATIGQPHIAITLAGSSALQAKSSVDLAKTAKIQLKESNNENTNDMSLRNIQGLMPSGHLIDDPDEMQMHDPRYLKELIPFGHLISTTDD